MKYGLLAADKNLVEYVGDILLKDLGAIDQNLVVFSGKRPIHFLRKYLAVQVKKPYRSPQILSADSFIDFAYEELGNCARLVTPTDAVPVLFDLNKRENLVREPQSAEMPLDDFMPWAFELFSDLEELHIELTDINRLRETDAIAGEKLPPGIRARLISLSNFYTQFYEFIGKNNLSTRAVRYRTVAENIAGLDLKAFKNIIFAGFVGPSRCEQEILKNIAQRDNAIFLFQDGPGIEGILKSLGTGLELETGRTKPASDVPEHEQKINYYKAMDLHAEVFQLAALVKEQKTHDEKSLIVLPRADMLFPVIQQVSSFIGSDYNISMGYPLFRTPLYALLEMIGTLARTRLADGFYVPDYLKLVFHPYVKNLLLDKTSEPTRIIFHALEEFLIDKQRAYVSLVGIENDKEFTDYCLKRLKHFEEKVKPKDISELLKQVHRLFMTNFENLASIADFADKLLEVVSFVSTKSTACRHAYTVPFVKAMINALHELKTSGLERLSFCATPSYFRLLRKWIQSVNYPFEGTPVKGMQILGFLETRNLKFDTVFFMDANEGVVPRTKKEDAFLPYAVRRHVGLPTYEDQEKLSRHYFDTLLASAREINIFYIESADQEKSRFVERMVWQEQKKTKKLELGSTSKDISFEVDFRQKEPEPIKKSQALITYMEENLVFSASSIDSYLHCPLQFYYEKILGFKTREEVLEQFDPRQRGKAVHDILETFFLGKIGKKLAIESEDYKTMDQIVEKRFAREYQQTDTGKIFLLKAQIKSRMADVLDLHRQDRYKGIEIVECENSRDPNDPREHWDRQYGMLFALPSGKKVKMIGFLDRVDRRNGSYMILDYKTGADAEVPRPKFLLEKREEWHKTLYSVQLPIYIMIYAQAKSIDIESLNSSLLLIGKNPIVEKQLFDDSIQAGERAETFGNYQKAVAVLIEEILSPDLDFTPAPEPKKTCPYCPFRTICGTHWLTSKW